jgi:hypothetical protein
MKQKVSRITPFDGVRYRAAQSKLSNFYSIVWFFIAFQLQLSLKNSVNLLQFTTKNLVKTIQLDLLYLVQTFLGRYRTIVLQDRVDWIRKFTSNLHDCLQRQFQQKRK